MHVKRDVARSLHLLFAVFKVNVILGIIFHNAGISPVVSLSLQYPFLIGYAQIAHSMTLALNLCKVMCAETLLLGIIMDSVTSGGGLCSVAAYVGLFRFEQNCLRCQF